jgi:hypothetical protein
MPESPAISRNNNGLWGWRQSKWRSSASSACKVSLSTTHIPALRQNRRDTPHMLGRPLTLLHTPITFPIADDVIYTRISPELSVQ